MTGMRIAPYALRARRDRTAVRPPRAPGLRRGLLGGPHVLAVGLVDGEHVGQLEDALLDALELVPRAREHEDQEEVDHRGNRELGLPDADRLDQHGVVARRLADEER